MKFSRSLITQVLLFVLLFLCWTPIALQASDPPAEPNALEYQLLTNPAMEAYAAPYGQYQGVNCQVAAGWQRFSLDAPEPCFMDGRVFAHSHLGGGWVESTDGGTSQMIVGTAPYRAGLWQRVTGLTPGVGYGFHAAMLTIFQTSAGDPDHGRMIKRVGIDPTGGTDPRSPAVVWSAPDGHDLGPWDLERRVSVYAQAPAATVFISVTSLLDAGPPPFLNLSFFDTAILARTPTVRAVSPQKSDSTSFLVRWDNAVAADGVKALKGYDVQWKDEAVGIWHNWISWLPGDEVNATQATFSGQRGHTYGFRARVWQKYKNGAHLHSPYRPGGDSLTYVQGPELQGRVVSNEGHNLGGARVSLSGTDWAAFSGAGGTYRIRHYPSTQAYTVAVDHPVWQAPAPVHGVTFGPTQIVTLDWVLRPPDDGVANGGFESGLDGWSPGSGIGGTLAVVQDPVHTGHGALVMGGQAGASTTVGLTQTVAMARSWEPALSFWYRPQSADPDDLFNLVLTSVTEGVSSTLPVTATAGAAGLQDMLPAQAVTVTQIYTPSLDGSDWQHLWFYPDPNEAYFTGTVTIHFQLTDDGDGAVTTVYLDEVSLGRTPGGPFRGYLPMILTHR
jgi:hypothetical protein